MSYRFKVKPNLSFIFLFILFLVFYKYQIKQNKNTNKNLSQIEFELDSLKSEISDLKKQFEGGLFSCIEKMQNMIIEKQVKVTSYNSLPFQCYGNPFITASGTKVSFKTLALSQDFITNYNVATPGLPKLNYGDTVYLFVVKPFIVEDTMNPFFRKSVDIWHDNFAESLKFGVKPGWLYY